MRRSPLSCSHRNDGNKDICELLRHWIPNISGCYSELGYIPSYIGGGSRTGFSAPAVLAHYSWRKITLYIHHRNLLSYKSKSDVRQFSSISTSLLFFLSFYISYNSVFRRMSSLVKFITSDIFTSRGWKITILTILNVCNKPISCI